MNGLTLVLILVGGFLAGVINTVAGGGSIITLPLLIFAGLPPSVANGTNRVAIVLQNVGAMAAFRRHGYTVGKPAWLLLIPSVLGALAGVSLAVSIDEAMLRRVIGVVLVLMLIPLLRKRNSGSSGGPVTPSTKPWVWPVYFLVGAYGGFLQAGVGFLYLALLVGAHGMDLVRANVLKVFFILVYSALALALFAADGKVALLPGLALAVGTTGGGWVGAKMAVEKGEGWIRGILVLAILAAAAKLTGLLDAIVTRL